MWVNEYLLHPAHVWFHHSPGFPSPPAPFQTEGSFFPRPSSSASFKVDSLTCKSTKDGKKLQPRTGAFCLGVEVSLLCCLLEANRKHMQGGGDVKSILLFFQGAEPGYISLPPWQLVCSWDEVPANRLCAEVICVTPARHEESKYSSSTLFLSLSATQP